jgi:hypothetical protein
VHLTARRRLVLRNGGDRDGAEVAAVLARAPMRGSQPDSTRSLIPRNLPKDCWIEGLSAVREFILPPVTLVDGTLLLVIVTLALPVIACALWAGERGGYLRCGRLHRDEPDR